MTTRGMLLACVAMLGITALWLPAPAAAQTAEQRYTAAKRRDDRVRDTIAHTAPAPGAARTKALAEARAVIAAYDQVVRRHWRTGYADNALFNAASLAETLYERFGLDRDRRTALAFYTRLRKEYPTAPLARQSAAHIARLEQAPAGDRPAAAAKPAVEADTIAAGPPAAGGAASVRLTAIERTVLPEAVRVILALDREVPFKEERLDGPARLFFDLQGVEAVPELTDAVLRFHSDVVRQIRLGRHPDALRVVLDLEEARRYSVYPLYNPFRIVVDVEPETAASNGAAVAAAAPPSSAPAVDAAPAVLHVDGNGERGGPVPPATPAPASSERAAPIAAATPPEARGPSVSPPPRPADEARSPTPPLPTTSRVPPTAPVAPTVNGAGGFSIARQLGLGVSRVVIDPGHGGHDPGAQVRGVNEADLTLDIALRLEKLLKADPGLEVILTRRDDVYVPLEERTAIANREGADLFLSIHANTSRNTAARGVETYYLSFAGSPDAEAVAARENSSHAGEMRKLPDIIKAIALNNKLDESRDFAAMVQEALVARLQRTSKAVQNRGVKKAPFVVLIGAEMPSVLAEVSFMSNRQELQLLKSAAYKDRIAESLHAAIMRYRRSLKGAAAIAAQ